MPRIARIVVEGIPHHITQRGNHRAPIFFSDHDRKFYLSLLKKQSMKHGLEVHGYCLMTNHVHIVGTPSAPDSMALAIGRSHHRYAQYLNQRLGRTGHVFQNRFRSCPLDLPHYWLALRYSEQNPVRARIVRLPWAYEWSSAAAHVGLGNDRGLLDLEKWWASDMSVHWRAFLIESLSEETLRILRAHTLKGRPLGDQRFLAELEKRTGRQLRPCPAGRPKKRRS